VKSHLDHLNVPDADRRDLMKRREQDIERVRAYYRCLNADPAFRRALADLARKPEAERETAIDEFVRAWHLPKLRGPIDLRHTLNRFADRPERIRLIPRPVAVPGNDPAMVRMRKLQRQGGDSDRELAAPAYGVTVSTPQGLVTLDLDPSAYTAKTLERLFRSLAKEATQIAASARNQLELGPLPSRHRPPEDLDRYARRLHRAAVLGQSYEAIADAEDKENPTKKKLTDIDAVRGSVTQWAKRLGVPLPARKVGRPRRNP
jgi:hypothetical protein